MSWVLSFLTASVGLLLEPLRFSFMLNALVATVLVAIVCAVIGTFVVLKGLAFIGDAVAHASFAGIATAYLLGGNIYLGAGFAAVATATGIAFLSRRGRVSFDTAIGVLFVGAFSLGIVLMSRVRNYAVDLLNFVFGNVLGVGQEDVILVGVMSFVVLGIVFVLYKELLFYAFDAEMASVVGLPAALLHYLILVLLAITTIVAMKVVGIVLVVAMLVTPPAAAGLLTKRFSRMMLVGTFFSIAGAVIGLYLSYYIAVPSGAAIVLVDTCFFLIALALPRRLSLGPEPQKAAALTRGR
ncbi:MAG: metal ABC transporter permease [Chloroflexi bacterium]|nr:metal ABC transporter permease [Chloroflexota bacterium]